jgi:hypothetical protein
MSYTETTSWFTRIKNALFGIIFGFAFFIGSFFLLAWNEKNSVETYQSLKEGQSIVKTINANEVDPGNNGKLVHLSGFATTNETLEDLVFNVSGQSIQLKRHVEMYQWEEEKESKKTTNVGGSETTTTNYSYFKEWSDTPIVSSRFKEPDGHQNPAEWRYRSQTWKAAKVTLKAFSLSEAQISDLTNFQALSLKGSDLPQSLADSVKMDESGYYIGNNPQSPEVGDIKISFSIVKPEDVSIIAKQVNDTFEPYHTQAGHNIDMIETGIHSSEFMFAEAFKKNEMMTWAIRLGGFILMWVGLVLMCQLLTVVADVLPIMGNLVGFGVGLLTGIVALGLSFITIAIAWVGFHPMVGVPLLVLGLLFLFGTIFLKRRHPKAEKDQTIQKS